LRGCQRYHQAGAAAWFDLAGRSLKMDLTLRQQGDVAQIEVVGSIDERGAEELKRRFLELDISALKEVVFNFSGVTFIGSAGIGKLLLFYKNVAAQGGKIRIENMSKDIYTMFKVVKLDKIFNISPAK
jgi:anti-anti-sigma factor